MTFRLGDKGDLPELCSLLERAKETLKRQHIFQWDDMYPDKAALTRDIGRGDLSVGVEQGCIRVFYVLNRECNQEYENGDWKHQDVFFYIIHRLCVDPDFQGQGIGRQAMEHMERQAVSLGAGAVRLDAFMENALALGFYKALGYEIVGVAHWRKGRFCLMEKYLDVLGNRETKSVGRTDSEV